MWFPKFLLVLVVGVEARGPKGDPHGVAGGNQCNAPGHVRKCQEMQGFGCPANVCANGLDLWGCTGVCWENPETHRCEGITPETACPGYCGGAFEVECPSGQFCKYPVGRCLSGTINPVGTCVDIPTDCDGGKDPTPVCGCDEQTYGSECEALRALQNVGTEGECETVGPLPPTPNMDGAVCNFDTPCDKGEICLYPTGSCEDKDPQGICVEEPAECAPITGYPVCGCDGQEYTGACEALISGVTVASEGACDKAA